jgi:NADPH-dependent 7-cyano-7-deazaguanine reductase QueF
VAVLHITYQPDAGTDSVAYEGFCNLLESYKSIRLSKSNWAINTEELPKAVWQKLKYHLQPHDYVIMFPLDESLLTAQGERILGWILARP